MTQASATTEAEKPAPPPPPTFDAIPLGADIRKAVDALGYTHPTPVQLAVFEPASRGKSLVVQARTGTGKTAAFGLPIVDVLVKRSVPHVQALILTPTRELALQVGRELEQLSQHRGTKIVPIYGGAPMGRQVDALKDGAQVVTGTPGRVLDHLRRGTLDPSNIRIFVLDEADEMLSMGFQKELHAIIEMLPKDRQGLYFSATIPPDVERLANNHLKDPEYVTLSSDQIGALELSHFVYLVREGDKRSALVRIIEVEDPASAVVFCNTKDETERVAEALKNRGYEADWLNGDLEQKDRERVMAATREGKLRFLVATDVAARGIDISHLTHVINADFPESAEQYVHRTGRTGRAGRTGTAISVVGPKDVGHLYMLRLTYKIRPIERMLPTSGELRTRAEADMIAFLADAYVGKTRDPHHLAVARRLLTHESAEVVIAGLLADHLGATAPEDAADARRAKNPPPIPAEAAALPASAPAARPPPPPRPDRPRDDRPRNDRPRDDRPRADRPANDRPRDARPPRNERPRENEPRTLRDGESRVPAPPPPRGTPRELAALPRQPSAHEEAPRGDRERRPVSSLSSWEPPAENDDDAPLFNEAGTKPGLGAAPPAGRPAAGAERGARGDRSDRSRDRGRSRGGPRPQDSDLGAPADASDLNQSMPAYHVEDEPTIAFTGRLPPPRSPEPRPAREPREARPPREPREDETPDDPSFQNVFLNVGRRDGLQSEDVQRILIDKAGLTEADVGHIRLRDRITFVGIKKEHVEEAMKAIIGVTVGERTLNAEIARDR